MIVAIFKYPNRGTEYDQALVKQYHLRLEQEYEIERIEMSQGRMDIYLKNMQVAFNSVHFTFKEDEKKLNIYTDKRFNTYI